MLGNGVCDDTCNTVSCFFDDGDCECHEGCSVHDFASCPAECLNYACGYANYGREGGCNGAFERDAALAAQALNHDFFAVMHWDECFAAEHQCTLDIMYYMWYYVYCTDWWTGSSYEYVCVTKECLYMMGLCSFALDASCYLGYGATRDDCFYCKEGYMQVHSTCLMVCPRRYQPDPVLSYMCTPRKDDSTEGSPDYLYVHESRRDGAGNLGNPYGNLQLALAAAWKRYTIIYLLGDSLPLTVNLTSTNPEQLSLDSRLDPLGTSGFSQLTVTSLTCEEMWTDYCSRKRTEIDVVMPVIFTVTSSITFQNVIFTTRQLFAQLPVQYCPVLEYSRGKWLDTSGEEASPGMVQALHICENYTDYSLFIVKRGGRLWIKVLVTQDAEIREFMIQPKAFIDIQGGSVFISRVNFTNIHTQRLEGVSSVILQSEWCDLAACGSLSLENVTVSYLNNGVKYSESIQLQPFLRGDYLLTVRLRNVVMHHNFIVETFSNSMVISRSGLVYLQNFHRFSLENCDFRSNIVSAGLVVVASSVSLPKSTEEGKSEASWFLGQHVVFSDISVLHNLGAYSLITVQFAGDVLNIDIARVNIKSNGLLSRIVLSLSSETTLDASTVTGVTQVVLNPTTGLKESVWVAPRHCTISELFITEIHSYTTLVYINRLPNVEISIVDLSGNGDVDKDTLVKLYQLYVQDPAILDKLIPDLPAPTSCTYSMWCDQSINVAVVSLRLVDNSCSTGSCGLRVLGNTGVTSITDFLSTNNTCTSQNALALDALDYISVTIRSLSVSNNVNREGAMVTFGSRARVDIADSSIQDNIGRLGTAMRMSASQSLLARRVTFRNNEASQSTGGVLYWLLENYLPVTIDIESCAFENNEATRGGAIALEASNVTTVDLHILNSYFTNNTASLYGAALYVGLFIDFAEQSTIQSISFKLHHSIYGVVYLLHHGGSLRFADCEFTENTGSVVSGLLIETEASAVTTLEDILFYNNLNAPTLLKSNSRTNSTFITRRCIFRSNDDSDVVMEGGVWEDFGGLFSESDTSELLLSARAMATLTDTLLENNFEIGNGGAVHLLTKSSLTCNRCVFLNNTAAFSGGAIFAEQNSYVVMEECTFRNNSATAGGGVLFIVSSLDVTSVLASTVIEDNDGGQFGAVLLQSAVLALSNVTFRRNTATDIPGITELMSTLYVSNSRFSDMHGLSVTFIALYTNSFASIADSEFSDGQSAGAGLLQLFSTSTLTVTRTTFQRLSGYGVIAAFAESAVSLSQVTMTDIDTSATGSLVRITDSTLFAEKSTFTNFGNGGIDAKDMIKVEIRESKFFNGAGTQGTAGEFFQCKEVVIAFCSFQQINARSRGGALLFEALEVIEQKPVQITDCEFIGNNAVDGGAMFSINTKLRIAGSHFESNSAERGGALTLECSLLSMCAYNLTDTDFVENYADVKGGAIAWSTTKPSLAAVTFRNNSAQYGPDIASYPISLKVDQIRAKRLLEELTFAPGQAVTSAILASLRDHYGQVITIDNSSIGVVESTEASISGSSRVFAEEGVFTFDNFIVYARPNSSVGISLSSTAIASDSEGDPDPHAPSLQLTIVLRDCEPGEVRSVESCGVCSAGTYSFDPSTPCQTCSRNAECLGGYIVIPSKGYWRSGIYSATLRECPNPAACLGGGDIANDKNLSLTGKCATGFKGNLCQSCDNDYSRTGKNKCDKCPPRDANSVKLAFIAVAVLIGIFIMVSSTMRSATRPAATHSIMIRIFVNYLQLVTLVTEFKLSWPKPVLKLFETQESAGGVTEQAYSIDCFLTDGKAVSDTYYRKMVSIAVMPVPLIIGAVLFWLVISVRKRNFLLMRRECLATVVILFFLILPNIVKAMFSMFSCTEIEPGEYWLTVDMDIRCWDATHTFNVLVVGLPAILVWVLAVPLMCLSVIVKNRRQQDELWMRMQYGFLINGYRRRCYYWEFVILYRKIIIICCAVFLNNSIPVQALTVQFVLLIALFLQYRTMPYKTPLLNSLEMWAITVADVTIYSGLYYLTNTISDSTAWFLFLVILLANVIFVLYWLFGLLDYFADLISFKFHRIGRILRPGRFVDLYIEEFVEGFQDSHTDEFPYVTLKECCKKMIGLDTTIVRFEKKGYKPRIITVPTSFSS